MSAEHVKDFSELDEIVVEETGRRIKFLVQSQGLSQSQLAKILGRDAKTISNYYCGKSLPDKKDLIVLARILGVRYDEILVFRGDIEGYQRIQHYNLECNEECNTISDAINKSQKESKLFNPHSKGRANIRNLVEAGLCMEFFSSRVKQDICNRIVDTLLSGRGVDSTYMHHIYENYIWRKLSEEQKEFCKSTFAYERGETEKQPSDSDFYRLINKEQEGSALWNIRGY
ncbi:helix-turn-helix domain-containing protein [Priestia megaterium]|uniref:helix-turn-helix domain-containing protein n=1 Tax=Priestia TaxID=2800373 RepID=UPI000CA1B9BD|nr:helix-turn-helix transcriptional regulator [Priestia megaterium]AUO10396.1 XRE family transcriptional regulator [Priestia megaterium]MEB4856031.1 helix-turn-helix transcriptional regulator [Priestia megaterium]